MRAHRNLSRVKWDLFSKQQDQLTELATTLVEEKGTPYMVQLKQLQHREKMVKDYRAVKSVLKKVTNKRKGGGPTLTKLQSKEN